MVVENHGCLSAPSDIYQIIENKSHVNIMVTIGNRTRKNHRGGYRYSELGMKGLTIALSDGARVVAPKKSRRVKKRTGKKIVREKKGRVSRIGRRVVRKGKGSHKRGKNIRR